ncbi:MAG: hypothetical protein ACI4F5_02130 [Acutalibacteraceae bacterium]
MKNKNRIKAFLYQFMKICFAGLSSVVILSLFVVIYRYEGIHIRNLDGSTDYKWEPGQLKTQMVEGFSFLRMDSFGFNNAESVDTTPDILLMGSSHMEALELMQKENTSYLLNEKLEELSTYNIGISGHTIYRCVDNFENAVKTYNPGKYVIIETDRVSLDMKSMSEVVNGSAKAIASYDSGIMYYLQKIPAVKLLYSQFEKWISTSQKVTFEKPYTIVRKSEKQKEDKNDIDDEYEELLSQFLRKISVCADKNNIKVIIFYQPSEHLNEEGIVTYATDEKYLSAFSKECTRQGIIFIDMTSDFEKLYYENHILAHGFSNTAVGVGHLNKYGHYVIADRLSTVINETEAEK